MSSEKTGRAFQRGKKQGHVLTNMGETLILKTIKISGLGAAAAGAVLRTALPRPLASAQKKRELIICVRIVKKHIILPRPLPMPPASHIS
ncbi:MAG: hypothetical protein LUG59_05945, partial [Enterocloster clostridioformis]|nr:hypothetical protein [Enterocloster clostridioformis]